MSLTPEQASRRALAWERFWEIAAEVQARQEQRDARAARLQVKGYAQEDFDEADRVMREIEQGIRQLRKAMKALPELLSEAGCGVEVDELRRHLNRLSAAWRDLKVSWRNRVPRTPA